MEEIIKLNDLETQYKKMVESGAKLKDKLKILNEIKSLSELLSRLIGNNKGEIYRIGRESKYMQWHHNNLSFKSDFFFDNLLYGLNRDSEKFDKINLVFGGEGCTGTDAYGGHTYGSLHYNYMVAGTIDLINSISETDFYKENFFTDFFDDTIEAYVKGYNNDIIICSTIGNYIPEEINGVEQRIIDLADCFPGNCRYYKGEFAPEIDFVIDAMIKTAKVYGVDFRTAEYQQQLSKKKK